MLQQTSLRLRGGGDTNLTSWFPRLNITGAHALNRSIYRTPSLSFSFLSSFLSRQEKSHPEEDEMEVDDTVWAEEEEEEDYYPVDNCWCLSGQSEQVLRPPACDPRTHYAIRPCPPTRTLCNFRY